MYNQNVIIMEPILYDMCSIKTDISRNLYRLCLES